MKPVKVANYLSLIVAIILMLLPFHAFFTTWLGSNTGHLDLIRIWKEIILVLVVPVAVWLAWRQPNLKSWLFNSWIVRLYVIYVLLHVLLGLVALHTSQVNRSALIYALIINLRFIGFFIVCYIAATSSELLKKKWRAILLIPASLVVMIGVVQRFLLPYDFLQHFGYGPNTIPAYQTVDANLNYRRIQSTLRGANPLGAYLVLMIPAFLTVVKSRAAKIAIVLLSFIVLFYSYSRSAIIGVFLALIVLAWLTKAYAGRLRWLAIISLIILLIGVGGFLKLKSNQSAQDTILHTSTSSGSKISANDVRTNALRMGLNDIIIQPLGRGPGTAGPASFRTNGSARIAENYYIQLGQEVGVIGLGIFAAINVLVALQLWHRRNEKLPQILLASLAGITFVNLLSHAWTDDTLAYLWWGLAGIALAPIITSRQKLYGKKHKEKI
jgi:hypothetical protein